MRLANIGEINFVHNSVKQVGFRSDETFLDFDILLWNPGRTITTYFTNTQQMREQSGGVVFDQGLFEKVINDIRRRDNEMMQMLGLGRTIYINTPPPQFCYSTSSQTVNLLHYFTIAKFDTTLASGTNITFRGGEPFSAVWDRNMHYFSYQAYFNESIGNPLFYIGNSKHVIGSYLKVGQGHIVFIPLLTPLMVDQRELQQIQTDFIDSLIALADVLQKTAEDFTLPEWSKSYHLPHEINEQEELLRLEEALNLLSRKISEKQVLLRALEMYKILFIGTGKLLELQVKKIFEELGFTVSEGEPNRDDLILKHGTRSAVVEVKGIKKSAAENHARQLEQWVSEYYLAHNGEKAKGILIANTFRDTPLEERNEASFPPQMVPFSQVREHCLMTGLQLLGLYLDCKEDEEKKQRIIELLFTTNGVFPEYQDWTTFIAGETANKSI